MDARVRRSRETVLATTFELLADTGVGGFTVDEVARRSGVAKTTIYRHWPTREALVIDASSRFESEQAVPDTGSLEGDLLAVLGELADLLATAAWTAVLPSIVDAAERDDAFAAVHRDLQRGHAAPLRAVIERAVERGEVPQGTDPETLVPLLMGPLFYRRWFARDPIDPAFVAAVVRHALAA